jgi:hypothetical protein
MFLTAAAACLAAAVVNGASGVVITQKITSGTDTRTSQVQLDQNHMRAEVGSPNGGKQVVIFDGTRQVMDILHADGKTYNEITKADMDRLATQVSGAMAQMQAAMANMPPEQRAQLEAAMKGRGMNMPGAAAAAAKPEYRKGGTATIGKWTCQKYEGYENGEKTSEICTVPPSTLGFGLNDFAVTRQMMDFVSGLTKMMPGVANQMFTIGSEEAQGFSGIPVWSKRTVAGRDFVTEITDVTRTSIPESAFQVPAGLEKQPFLGGMGRGGR